MININLEPRKFLQIILITLIISSIITLTYASLNWRDDWKLTEKSIEKAKLSVNSDPSVGLIEAISDHHLFGINFAKTGEVPLSNLEISVTGIVKVGKENSHALSKAYISVAGAPSKIYQIGDTLPSGVKIYNITPQEIILNNGGQLEKLRLAREKLAFKSRNSSA